MEWKWADKYRIVVTMTPQETVDLLIMLHDVAEQRDSFPADYAAELLAAAGQDFYDTVRTWIIDN